MPVYEYEHLYDESEMCELRFAVVQNVDEEHLMYCPSCGLEVRRVISQVSIIKAVEFDADKAAKKGFTTWRRSGEGEWEKIAGVGTDMIVGTPEDIQAVHDEKKPTKGLDLSGD